jgi:hypothetical protein
LDFRKFVREGIAVAEVEPLNDAMVQHILSLRERNNG